MKDEGWGLKVGGESFRGKDYRHLEVKGFGFALYQCMASEAPPANIALKWGCCLLLGSHEQMSAKYYVKRVSSNDLAVPCLLITLLTTMRLGSCGRSGRQQNSRVGK